MRAVPITGCSRQLGQLKPTSVSRSCETVERPFLLAVGGRTAAKTADWKGLLSTSASSGNVAATTSGGSASEGMAVIAHGLVLSYPAAGDGSADGVPTGQFQGQGRRVLDGLDLRVRRGSLHMLLGANGCGKVGS
jgi:hypothetical protein